MMTIAEWLKRSTQYIDRLDAELIIAHNLKIADRSYLVSHDEEELPEDIQIDCDAMLAARLKGKPLAYLLGYREFYGRNFIVTPDVLIPRPETEDIIALAKKSKAKQIVDVGTGSGCIAVTLALEMPNTEVIATDISGSALTIAQKNASQLGAKLTFRKADLLDGVDYSDNALIIANLPYVDEKWGWLDRRGLDYEPASALYAEQGGLALIYKLIDSIKKPCQLILEADTCQHDQIIAYAAKHGFEHKKTQGYILQFIRK